MKPLHHPLAWAAPRPLWRGAEPASAAPTLLRFASDDFMEQLLALLAEDPGQLGNRVARAETWRDPPQPHDLADPRVPVPVPAPMREARRARLLRTPPAAPPPPADAPIRLWQPAQQRYYLAAASLACAIPGLPDRALAGGHERVGFVLRRLLPASGRAQANAPLVEYAHVKDGDNARWQRVEDGLAPGEELLPLFPLRHKDASGANRTLWAGLIPVARREAYMACPVATTAVPLAVGQAAALDPPPAPAPANSSVQRTTRLRMEVMEPWKAMLRSAIKAAAEIAKVPGGGLDAEPADKRRARVFEANVQYQMQSWLLIADLRAFIRDHLPAVEAALVANSAPAVGTPARDVWNALGGANADTLEPALRHPNSNALLKPMGANLREAVRLIPPHVAALEAATTHYTAATAKAKAPGWPDFHFPLAGIRLDFGVDGPFAAIVPPAPQLEAIGNDLNPPGASGDDAATITSPADVPSGSGIDPEQLDRLTAVLARALPVQPETNAQPLPHAMKLRDILIKTAGDPGLFQIRMVHLNEDCGPLHPPTLSAPSAQFRLGSFFDPDAPVRPITITLPGDTSPAGLRKHGRGAAFVMSDMLCGQVQRAKGLGFIDLVLQVLPWPFHKDIDIGDGGGCKGGGLDIGMICSISIPIITLCALILLMIMVTLFDFIFRWLPWFIACFPVPKLKGKS